MSARQQPKCPNRTHGDQGFAGDPNIDPYVDSIYAYLQARADCALGTGRPMKLEQ